MVVEGRPMGIGQRCRRVLRGFVLYGLMLMVPSCTGVDRHMGRATEEPAVPPDTVVVMALPAEGQTPVTAAPTDPPGPLKVSITEAILQCLENNAALIVQRLNPSIQQTIEDQEKAVFDPLLNAEVSVGRVTGERLARSGSETETFTTDTADGMISLEHYFPTGTTVTLEADLQIDDSSLYSDSFYASRLGMTVTQALLRGFGSDTNLARLRQARLDTRLSEYELRGFTELLVADLERTYWDYALSLRQIEIVEESLRVARQQLSETGELIAVGRLAKAEIAAVQAEVASQEQALIEARAGKEIIRLRLLRLLNPSGTGIWQREIELLHQPVLPEIKLEDVELHVALAKRMQPILNEARLELLNGDLELVKTRNGLLPQLDLFITLGKSGYANSFVQSIENFGEGSYDAMASVRITYPVANRDAKARHRRALLTRQQTHNALENLTQLVELDVRTAHIEVSRTRQQIAATSVTRRFDEEKLRTETEKLRVGKSTSFMVAQAQRDLLVSRIAEVRALTNYLKALIYLYRQDGSLLQRRGITAPGSTTVNH
jgi:outer membrane protein